MGLFIAFEGVDGSGKSTQARLLHSRLRRRKAPVRLVREPGATALGERLRRILASPRVVVGVGDDPDDQLSLRRARAPLSIDPLAEVFLFAAARAQLVKEIILPSLREGITVLSDRYVHSTMAYQGYGRGIDLAALEAVNRISTDSLLPDLIVLLDADPAETLLRRGSDQTATRFEEEELDFHERIRKGYLEMARDCQVEEWLDKWFEEDMAFHQRIRKGYLEMAGKDPTRWLVLDASLPKESLAAEVWRKVSGYLGLRA